jgi:8-oxo-dGTP pyrophosphatase MutT (NUDIX family)
LRAQDKVEVFVFVKNPLKYLLLKRGDSRGGFWQPVTGSVEAGEDVESAVERETREETGLSRFEGLIDTGYSFEFEKGDTLFREFVFGIEVLDPEVVISDEHVSSGWFGYEEAVSAMPWPENRKGLEELHGIISKSIC